MSSLQDGGRDRKAQALPEAFRNWAEMEELDKQFWKS